MIFDIKILSSITAKAATASSENCSGFYFTSK